MSEPTMRAFSAAQAVLTQLGRDASDEERAELASVIDRAAGLPGLIDATRKAIGLLEQVDKHLDPYPGQDIKLWKRAFIEEMQTHLRGARALLQETVELET